MKEFTERYYRLIWVKKYGEVTEVQKPDILRMLQKELDEKIQLKTVVHKYYDINYIQGKVCKYFNLTVEQINIVTRKEEILRPRQISMFFGKQLTKLSLAKIGEVNGNKGHATVLSACKTINNLIETDKKFAIQIKEIEKNIKSNRKLF